MLEHIERLKAWQALDLPSGIERSVHQNRLLKIAREGGQMTPADLAKFEAQRRYATLVALAIGVLIALRPSGDDLQAGFVTVGGLATLGAALCYAIAAVTGRLATRTDSSESMVLWMMVLNGAVRAGICSSFIPLIIPSRITSALFSQSACEVQVEAVWFMKMAASSSVQ